MKRNIKEFLKVSRFLKKKDFLSLKVAWKSGLSGIFQSKKRHEVVSFLAISFHI